MSRRLSKLTSLSAHAALMQTLEKSAGTQTLAELVSARHRERAATEQARHHREQERAAARAARKVRPAFRDAAAWHAWFDGSAHPNPGKIGIGGVLESPDGDVVKISARAGHGDSCEAEYLALIAVLEAAVSRKPAPAKLVIHGDSQVVIEDVLRDEASSAPALSHLRGAGARSDRATRRCSPSVDSPRPQRSRRCAFAARSSRRRSPRSLMQTLTTGRARPPRACRRTCRSTRSRALFAQRRPGSKAGRCV